MSWSSPSWLECSLLIATFGVWVHGFCVGCPYTHTWDDLFDMGETAAWASAGTGLLVKFAAFAEQSDWAALYRLRDHYRAIGREMILDDLMSMRLAQLNGAQSAPQ